MKFRLLAILLCMFTMLNSLSAKTVDGELNVVFIGNSITYGALHEKRDITAPPVIASQLLEKKTKKSINWKNCGWSGATTYDFLPSHNRYFPRVKAAVLELQKKSSLPIVFSIMLGTNDSACNGPTGSPVSNNDYKANLITIMDSLRAIAPGAIFVLHLPTWYSPNTYNGAMYLKAGLDRLEAYSTPIHELAVERTDVYLGDFNAFDFFKGNYARFFFPEEGNAGIFYLHPNEKGAVRLARYWVKSILQAVQ